MLPTIRRYSPFEMSVRSRHKCCIHLKNALYERRPFMKNCVLLKVNYIDYYRINSKKKTYLYDSLWCWSQQISTFSVQTLLYYAKSDKILKVNQRSNADQSMFGATLNMGLICSLINESKPIILCAFNSIKNMKIRQFPV